MIEKLTMAVEQRYVIVGEDRVDLILASFDEIVDPVFPLRFTVAYAHGDAILQRGIRSVVNQGDELERRVLSERRNNRLVAPRSRHHRCYLRRHP